MVNSKKNIYLDGSSTSPPRVDVVERVRYIQNNFWANPSSLHNDGIKAAEVLERSRQSISSRLGASPEEVVFTSGSTESNRISIIGSSRMLKPGRIVISAVEHPSVLSAAQHLVKDGWQLEFWPVDENGQVDLSKLDLLLQPPTKLVSIIWGQSEVGTLQPISTIGQACRDKGIIFHTDATQILSQSLFNWRKLPADLLSLSAHKFQGPKGVGILLNNHNSVIKTLPLIADKAQENGYRPGTQPVALIAGMALAIEHLDCLIKSNSNNQITEYLKVYKLTQLLRKEISTIDSLIFTGHPTNRLNNHISMLVGSSNMQPISARTLVRELSKEGICASSGTACKSSSLEDSAILEAMQIPCKWRKSGLRFSLGPWLEEDDIIAIPDILRKSIISVSN